MGVLGLTACGGGDDAIYEIVDPSSKASFFGYDIATAKAGDDLTKKTYQVDKDKNFIVNYSQTPKQQTESLRSFLTRDEVSGFLPPQNTANAYLIGERTIFNDTVLEYEPSNFGRKVPFKLTYQLRKIDLSGQNVSDYLKYFLSQANDSPSVSDVTLTAIRTLITTTKLEKFPANTACWQKVTQLASQDYIEFYPPQSVNTVSNNSTIQFQDTWQTANWTLYQPHPDLNLANVRIRKSNQENWGFFHQVREVNATQPNDVLACDFFNETAFKTVDKALNTVF